MQFFQNNLSGRKGRDLLSVLVMGGPAFFLLVIFMIWPFILGIDLSTTNQRFDGAQASDVGTRNYERILSVGIAGLPPKPDVFPDSRPNVGWYLDNQGNADFRWRTRGIDDLDEIWDGLERWRSYEVMSVFSIMGNEYALFARDPLFWKSLRNNLAFAAFVVPVQTMLALLLAILINQKLPGMNVFRTVYFSPVVTAMVIVAVVWAFLYNPRFGLINQMLSAFSVGPFDWLQHPASALPAIMIMSIWQGVGFQMVIFLAGLQDIPEDLYEAASIDGAGVFHKFRYVTLPMLRNTTIFVVLTTTILAFRLFDQINVMTPDGGPASSTATMVWYAIRRGWRESEIGYASAISVVFVVIVLMISLVQRVFVKSESALD